MPKPAADPSRTDNGGDPDEGIEVLVSDAPGTLGGGLVPFPTSDGIEIIEGALIVTEGKTQLAAFAPAAWLIAARPSVMRASLKVEPPAPEGDAQGQA